MNNYLKLKKSNCKNCYKCIRHCPVKSIRFSLGQAQIVADECILCGQCFVVCPQNAKEIRNDIAKVEALLAEKVPVYASVAPSFVANYEGATIKSMEKALKALGFTAVEETAIGATIVKQEYDRLLNDSTRNVLISSCCHSVNTLIQKYYPEALPYLAAVQSPMLAHSLAIKEAHPEAKTVFIGPCISKKEEADLYAGTVDCVLTFEELTELLNRHHVVLESIPDQNDASKARLFPTTGGILRTMAKENPDYTYLAVDGVENCINAIKDIANGSLEHCFIEMSACVGSCIAGPAMDKESRAPVRDYRLVDRYAGKEDFAVPQWDTKTLRKEMPYVGLHRTMPGKSAIDQVLKQMGKTRPEDELNCGSCGYDTCREKAIAVLQGKANIDMCLPFLKEKAENFSDNIIKNTPNAIIVLNEELEVQQINAAARDIMNIRYENDVLGEPVIRILDPNIFLDVLKTGRNVHDKRIYLAEYDRYVELSVVHDKSYHIMISIMRDITNEEKSRERRESISRQTIEITDKVVNKQMRVVQEIASLLGETTAETKIALTNLKEFLSDE